MASNKNINVPITSMSSDEIYALLDKIERDDEENIENLINRVWSSLISCSLPLRESKKYLLLRVL